MKRLLLLAFIVLAGLPSAQHQFPFTSPNFPGATGTNARGRDNHGELAGQYQSVPSRHAMLIKDGQHIPLAPTTVLGTNRSEAFKSSDRGDVVGQYIGVDGFYHGLLLKKEGAINTLDFPGASDTYAYGINESTTVVGYWDLLDANGNLLAYHGFTWKSGAFTEVDFPGSGDTAVLGINARGDFAGLWDSGVSSPIGHGFVCPRGSQCFSFDVPVAGSTVTQADDINAHGQIAGVYLDVNGLEHAFLVAGANFTSFDFPGATNTSAWVINSAGQIVGRYFTADGSAHGFLAQPANNRKPQ